MEDSDADDSVDSASCQQRPKVLSHVSVTIALLLFPFPPLIYDKVYIAHSVLQSTCARCSSYTWCCAPLCISWTCHMVPSGVYEKDMADTSKIVLAI